MKTILNSPLFGIIISIFAFKIGLLVQKKLKTPIANPLAIAVILIIAFLRFFEIPLENYQIGASSITLFLVPATAVLAISIYKQRDLLKRNFLPIVAGCFVGSLASVTSIVLLCRAFGLDAKLSASLLPKSVTTPIAMEIASSRGGVAALAVAAVIFTGILGAILAPLLIKLFRVRSPIARGIAIGTSSHAVGTTRAIELGEIEGAMSGIAIAIAGISTVIICLFF